MKIDFYKFYYSLYILANTKDSKTVVVVDRSEFDSIKKKTSEIFEKTQGMNNGLTLHDLKFKNQIKFLPTKATIEFTQSKEVLYGKKFDHVFFLKDEVGYENWATNSKFLVRNTIVNQTDKDISYV